MGTTRQAVNGRRRLICLIVVVSVAVGVTAGAWIVHTRAGAGRPTTAPLRSPSDQKLFELMSMSICGATTDPTSPVALRGQAHRLPEYASPLLATTGDRAAAARLFAEVVAAARVWRTPADASAVGYDTRQAQRRSGDTSVHYLHAEHEGYATDPRQLDPHRPKALIYANAPGHSLVLVGVMFSVQRGVHGPDPGGPITRWHWHKVCANGQQRGLKPRADGSSPRPPAARGATEKRYTSSPPLPPSLSFPPRGRGGPRPPPPLP